MDDDGSTSLEVDPTGEGEKGGSESCVDDGDSDENRMAGREMGWPLRFPFWRA